MANCGVPIAMLLCAWIIPRWYWRPLFVAIGLVAAIIWWLRRDIPDPRVGSPCAAVTMSRRHRQAA